MVLDGFGWHRRGADTFLLREDVAGPLEPLLRAALEGDLPDVTRLPGGRGTAVVAELDGDGSAVIRRNRRGGAVAWVVDDLYFGRRPRPFEEIVATERLRRASVPVPEALGALVRRFAGLWYRGAVATRFIPGAVTLWERLRQIPDPVARQGLCAAAIEAVRQLHGAGATHPDLNLQNFLVAGRSPDWKVWVIDCDGVRFGNLDHRQTSGVPPAEQAAVRRLERSARRLDPEARIVDPTWFRPQSSKMRATDGHR